jgi:LPXTG-site transpeptidase (sortase) family protein
MESEPSPSTPRPPDPATGSAAAETGDAAPSPPEKRRRRRWTWRRIVSDIIILAGVCLLLYVPSTWAWAWWQQRGLKTELQQANPILQAPSASFFRDNMVSAGFSDDVNADKNDLRPLAQKEAALAAQRASVQAFRDAAVLFAESVQNSEGKPIGKIVIPKIKLEWVVVQGVELQDMKVGPGHWPETPFPGMGGNFILSGHRNIWGGPFLHLDKVAVGDSIELLLPYVAARYEVTRSLIVKPTQVDVVAQRGFEQISLTTCDPPFTARNRLVVQAKMVEYKLLPAAGAAK